MTARYTAAQIPVSPSEMITIEVKVICEILTVKRVIRKEAKS